MGDAGGDDRVLAGLRGLRLQCVGQRKVLLGVLARQQVVVDDLAQKGVAEAVAPARVDDDDVGLGGLAHDRAQIGGAEAAGVGEHVVRQHRPRGEQPQDLLRRL